MCCAKPNRNLIVGFIATAQTLQLRTIVDGLAEIAANFAEFRIIYCCVDNTVIISMCRIRINTPRRENKFIKIVN